MTHPLTLEHAARALSLPCYECRDVDGAAAIIKARAALRLSP